MLEAAFQSVNEDQNRRAKCCFQRFFSTTFLVATRQLLKLPQTNDPYKVVCTRLELDCLTLESVMWHDFMFVVVDPGGAFLNRRLQGTTSRYSKPLDTKLLMQIVSAGYELV